jgi:hypothetical protein
LKKKPVPRDAGGTPALRRQRIRHAAKDVTSRGQQDTEARGVPSNVPPAPRKRAPDS